MRLADNHTGWHVEVHTEEHGWIPVYTRPVPTKERAKELLDNCLATKLPYEYRIYPATRREK